MIRVVKTEIVPMFRVMKSTNLINLPPQLTTPLIDCTMAGFNFSIRAIPISLILFFAWSSLAAAVADLVAA